jgi:8-oxo-dGTP diphosphatase
MDIKKKLKNHELIDGRLLQTNKKFSQLKESQKNLISEWFYDESLAFFKQSGKFPTAKNEKEAILAAVYEKIEERNIWIPFIEIKQYFSKKQTKLNNRISGNFNVESNEEI